MFNIKSMIFMGASHEYQEIHVHSLANDIIIGSCTAHMSHAALSDLTLSVWSPKSATNYCIALVGILVLFLNSCRIFNSSTSISIASDHTSQSSYPIVTCKYQHSQKAQA